MSVTPTVTPTVTPSAPVVNQINQPMGPKDEPKPVNPPVIANAPILPAKPLEVVSIRKMMHLLERTPSNWNLEPTDNKDIIYARNAHTGREFSGTRKEFSEMLRAD